MGVAKSLRVFNQNPQNKVVALNDEHVGEININKTKKRPSVAKTTGRSIRRVHARRVSLLNTFIIKELALFVLHYIYPLNIFEECVPANGPRSDVSPKPWSNIKRANARQNGRYIIIVCAPDRFGSTGFSVRTELFCRRVKTIITSIIVLMKIIIVIIVIESTTGIDIYLSPENENVLWNFL